MNQDFNNLDNNDTNQNNEIPNNQELSNEQNNNLNNELNTNTIESINQLNNINMQNQMVSNSELNQDFSSQGVNSISNVENSNSQLNNISKKNINIKLVIGIILGTLIIILGIIFIPKIINNKSDNSGQHLNNSITYINDNKSNTKKLAFLLRNGSDIEYVLTIKNDKKFDLSIDYLNDLYEDDLKVKIKDDYKFELVMNDLYININDEEISEEDEIIKQNGNWYLAKWSEEYTKICLKINNPNYSWKEDWLSFDITNDNNEDLNEKYFETMIEDFNVYVVSNNSKSLSFVDFANNNVDLSDYTFINDNIVSSLTKYEIYLKKSIGLEEIDSSIVYDSNDELYFIDLIDNEKYKEEIQQYKKEESFVYNKLNYEMYYDEDTLSHDVYVIIYRKINDKYIRVSTFVDNINDIKSIQQAFIKDVL